MKSYHVASWFISPTVTHDQNDHVQYFLIKRIGGSIILLVGYYILRNKV